MCSILDKKSRQTQPRKHGLFVLAAVCKSDLPDLTWELGPDSAECVANLLGGESGKTGLDSASTRGRHVSDSGSAQVIKVQSK